MTSAEKETRARAVQGMFASIAPRYDLMNRLMTGGMDVAWRREVIRRAALGPGSCLLDLGAGTGDLAREALRQQPDCRVVAGDFTLQMMLVGQQRSGSPQRWSGADALRLPFAAQSFDALVSGFLLRNVTDLDQALREQRRVLHPGGRWVALDTTHPRKNLLWPLISFHMNHVIPWLGGLLTGQRSAYTYLPQTSQAFLSAEEVQERLRAAGFHEVGFRRLNFGTVAIHWAVNPE
jgi:demethylmenaquinone methyltransferase/2-methoxy-6-polyprenyl-1,4-benzoquinol methylase